jgi:hypothetical protein
VLGLQPDEETYIIRLDVGIFSRASRNAASS